MMNFKRTISISFLVGVAVWAASLTLYLLTMAPSLTWGVDNVGVDGGELLTAASTFGVPHPPGYPTYTLLLRTFATLVPVGDFAFRGNLMSAVLASITIATLYAVVLRVSTMAFAEAPWKTRVTGSALGAIAFAASPLFWSLATITEVYTLNTAIAAVLVLLSLKIVSEHRESPDSARRGCRYSLAAYGALLGLGLGNHLTLLAVAVPVLVWMCFALGWRKVLSRWLIASFALGIAIYVYVPISASHNPPVNWGGASNVEGMIWLLTGRAYQNYLGVPTAVLPGRWIEWMGLMFAQVTVLGVFLGIVGARWSYLKARGLFWTLLASITIFSVYSVLFNSVDNQVLLIPAFMTFAVWLGLGAIVALTTLSDWLADALRQLSRTRHWQARSVRVYSTALLAVAVFAAIPATSVALNYGALDLSHDQTAHSYARGVLESVPAGSMVLSGMDGRVFSLWYVGNVEQPERDVLTIAVPLLQFDWYWRSLRQRYPERIPGSTPGDYQEALRLIVENNSESSPVYFTYRDKFLYDSFEIEREGDLFAVRTRPTEAPETASSPGRYSIPVTTELIPSQ